MSYTYAERRAMVTERREERRTAKEAEATAHYLKARAAVEHIPFGQPILVGHHSEGRHRRDLARQDSEMRKSIEASKQARNVPNATRAVLSTDSDAIEQLRAKVQCIEVQHARMIQANKLARKGDADGLRTMGYSEPVVHQLLNPPYAYLKAGFEPYMLTSNTAEIARLKKRIAALEAVRELPATEKRVGAVTIEEDPEAVRLRLRFPGKPPASIIADLKSAGFRWAPSESAWQRQLSNAARFWGEQIATKFAALEA